MRELWLGFSSEGAWSWGTALVLTYFCFMAGRVCGVMEMWSG